MCPFGMMGVSARREYFEEAVSRPKQAPLLDIDPGGNNKKGATLIYLPKEGRRALWSEPLWR